MKVSLKKSNRKDKKWMMIFEGKDQNGKIKTVHFGQKGYSDFTITKDERRKKLYLDRHKKRENWDDYMSPGSLSRWILWNLPSIQDSFRDYKKRFNLK